VRKSRAETEETRKRIIQSASEEFRRNGIERTGITELMSAAGLTHGGFYKHFNSKDEVVVESVSHSLESMLTSWEHILSSKPENEALVRLISGYLSTDLRDDFAHGCPFAALATEIARSGEAVRDVATTRFVEFIDLLAVQLKASNRSAARREALRMFTSMVGALVMSRMVTDEALSESILRETRKYLTTRA